MSITSIDLLTPKEVARLLKVGVRTLNRYMAAGELPVVRVGGKLARFRPSDIEAFINKNLTTKGNQ